MTTTRIRRLRKPSTGRACPECDKPTTSTTRLVGGGCTQTVEWCEWCEWHDEPSLDHEDI